MSDAQAPDRNLAMELVRVTEAAALASARWLGRGDKNAADGAAVDAMRIMLSTVQMQGVVVFGGGEKDEAAVQLEAFLASPPKSADPANIEHARKALDELRAPQVDDSAESPEVEH